ncbi:MAG: Hin recombinase [Actinobacteria bacterium]|nr:Hin recombinase [Actinomycetota bacterium]
MTFGALTPTAGDASRARRSLRCAYQERTARARGRTGGQKPKLTARQAKIAQDMYDDGRRAHTVQQIANEFGVTRPTIYRHLQRNGR